MKSNISYYVVCSILAGVLPSHAAPYDFLTFDVGLATLSPRINNSGEIVGSYVDSGPENIHGFTLVGGNYSSLDRPGNTGSFFGTFATGVNDSGAIVGTSFNCIAPTCGTSDSFVYTGGVYSSVSVPGASLTQVSGINNSGVIVGSYSIGANVYGFSEFGGNFTTFSIPGATWTVPKGINNSGQVVGVSMSNGNIQGFVQSAGTYTFLKKGALPQAINDTGQIVGFYTDGLSFLYSDGSYYSLSALANQSPFGNSGTFASGINDLGQIVGQYGDGRLVHGFVASCSTGLVCELPALPPPDSGLPVGVPLSPSTLPMLVFGSALLACCVRRRRDIFESPNISAYPVGLTGQQQLDRKGGPTRASDLSAC